MRRRTVELRAWHVALVACFGAACTAGAGGGAAGALVTAVVVGAALLAACGKPSNNKDPDVGPCLSPPFNNEFDMGPQPDVGPSDMGPQPDIGPCLSPPFEDMGPDPLDVGPCLSQPPPDLGMDAGDMGEVGALPARQKREILERLEDRLPADVAARLKKDHA